MTKNTVLFFAATLGGTLIVGEASARKTEFERAGSDTCFASTYVPNLVVEDTKGRLLQGPRPFVSSGIGGRRSGDVVRVGVEPAVYYKREIIKEREHYTLAPTACPGGR